MISGWVFLFFLCATLFVDSQFSSSARDLFKISGFFGLVASLFVLRAKDVPTIEQKKILWQQIWIGYFVLVYTYAQTYIHLPQSDITNQKNYIRFLFYLTAFYSLYLAYQGRFHHFFWLIVVSSMTLFGVWGYLLSGTGFAILFLYLVLHPWKEGFGVSYGLLGLGLFILWSFLGIFHQEILTEYFYGLFFYSSLFVLVLRVSTESLTEIQFILRKYFLFLILSIGIFLLFYWIQGGLTNENKSIGSYQVNSVGGSLIVFFPLVLSLAKKKNPLHLLFFLFVSILAIYLLYLTHTRSAILASLLFLTILIVHLFLRFHNRVHVILSIGAILGLGIPLLIPYLFLEKSTITFAIRWEIWKTYSRYISDHFFYSGAGHQAQNYFLWFPGFNESIASSELFRMEILGGATMPHAHNLFVQVFLEQGIIGVTLLFLTFAFFTFEWVLGAFVSRTILPGAFLVSLLVYLSFDYTLQDPNILLGLGITLGVLIKSSPVAFYLPLTKIPKYSWVMIFVVLIPSWILHTNHKQRLIFQEHLTIGNFMELDFQKDKDLELVAVSDLLDGLALGIYLDDKMAFFSALTKLYADEWQSMTGAPSRKEEFQNRISQCLRLNPHNPLCLTLEEHGANGVTSLRELSKRKSPP